MWKSIKHFKEQHPRFFDLLFYLIVLLAFAIFALALRVEHYQALRSIVFLLIGTGLYFLRISFKKDDLREPTLVQNLINNHNAADSIHKSSATKRNNSSAKLTTLFAGTFTVGIDIPPGRYIITADSSGNLFVREGKTSILGTKLVGGDGVAHSSGAPSITTNLEEGQAIEISGINNVMFTPAITQLSTVLTAGDWVVGLDIPPGIYNAFPTYEEIGNFFVRTAGGRGVVGEILNTTESDRGVARVRVNLEEGQRIQMHNISSVTFEQP